MTVELTLLKIQDEDYEEKRPNFLRKTSKRDNL